VTGCSDIGSNTVSTVIDNVYQQQYDASTQWVNEEQQIVAKTGDAATVTQKLADENIVFGPDNNPNDNNCDGYVKSSCCCKAHEYINGTGDVKIGCSLQYQCSTNEEKATSVNQLYHSDDINSCFDSNGNLKKRKGYDDFQCMGGTITDGNGDNAVFKVIFDDKGNSCFKSFNIDTIPSPESACTVEPSSGTTNDLQKDPFSGKAAILVNNIAVTRDSYSNGNTLTTCGLKITLVGTGANVKISEANTALERSCAPDQAGSYGFITANGISSCAQCQLKEGNYVYTAVPIQQCCGVDNERYAYCPGIIGDKGQICTKVGNIYEFQDWSDPRCDTCCSDACRFGSADCPYQNGECDIVTCT
jgi:hypothetical protein